MSHLTHMDNPRILAGVRHYQEARSTVGAVRDRLASSGGLSLDQARPGELAAMMDVARQDLLSAARIVLDVAHEGEPVIDDAIAGVAWLHNANRQLQRIVDRQVPTDQWAALLAPSLDGADRMAVATEAWLRQHVQATPRMT